MLLYDKKIILSILFSSPEFNIHSVVRFAVTISIGFLSPRFQLAAAISMQSW